MPFLVFKLWHRVGINGDHADVVKLDPPLMNVNEMAPFSCFSEIFFSWVYEPFSRGTINDYSACVVLFLDQKLMERSFSLVLQHWRRMQLSSCMKMFNCLSCPSYMALKIQKKKKEKSIKSHKMSTKNLSKIGSK